MPLYMDVHHMVEGLTAELARGAERGPARMAADQGCPRALQEEARHA